MTSKQFAAFTAITTETFDELFRQCKANGVRPLIGEPASTVHNAIREYVKLAIEFEHEPDTEAAQ